jgi:hypothetical protein
MTKKILKKIEGSSFLLLMKNKKIKMKKPIICSNNIKNKIFLEFLKDFRKICPHARYIKGKLKNNFLPSIRYFLNPGENQVVFFFEYKKKKNCLWIVNFPTDPLFCFEIENILQSKHFFFLGNILKWARPLILFDTYFGKKPHLKIIKKTFEYFFSIKNHSKNILSITDHVLSFCFFQNKIWFRVFQIKFSKTKVNGKNKKIDQLIEVGPRMTLIPIRGWSNSNKENLIYDSTVFKTLLY